VRNFVIRALSVIITVGLLYVAMEATRSAISILMANKPAATYKGAWVK
jgi:hypothetical protein